MKQTIYIPVLLFAILFIIYNCDNLKFPEEKTEVPRMRISKVSCYRNMDNAKVFEYNSENLLVTIYPEFFDSPLYFIYEIGYNMENKPVQITESMYLSGKKTEHITKIEWTKNGYILLNDEDIKVEFTLDEQDRIIGADNKIFSWFRDDSLIVENTTSNITEKFKYNAYNHPFSGINIAIMQVANIYLCDWEEWQNKYCVSEWEKNDNCSGKFFYTLNEQNYPIVMRKRFETYFGTSYKTLYFEYETY